MTQNATSAAQECIVCAIAARQAEAGVGLEDLDGATSAHVWSVGHDMARASRRSSMRCEGTLATAIEHGAAPGAPAMKTPGSTAMASLREVENPMKDARARV